MNPVFDIRTWMDAFAACVRGQDTDGARSLFEEDCHAFGTNVEEVGTLDALARSQWSPIWSTTEGFRFIEESVRTVSAGDGSLACVTAQWRSEGIRSDGTRYPRRGRCTIVLRAAPGSKCGAVAVHTHFSMSPRPAALETAGDSPGRAATAG